MAWYSSAKAAPPGTQCLAESWTARVGRAGLFHTTEVWVVVTQHELKVPRATPPPQFCFCNFFLWSFTTAKQSANARCVLAAFCIVQANEQDMFLQNTQLFWISNSPFDCETHKVPGGAHKGSKEHSSGVPHGTFYQPHASVKVDFVRISQQGCQQDQHKGAQHVNYALK